MKEHLNTLFVTTDGTYLAKDGAAVAVRADGLDAAGEPTGRKETKLRVPLHNLDGICCFGRVGASPQLLGAAAEAGVSVSFLSEYGRLRARVVGFTPGNVLLRRAQYRAADDPAATLSIARSAVIGKVSNCRQVLLRAARDAPDGERAERLRDAARRLETNLHGASRAGHDGAEGATDALRGVEGEAARTYFAAFGDLLAGDPAFAFAGRSRRPPRDAVNALLSFLYAMLTHDAKSAAESCGLDCQVGFLHRDRPGRPSLALDLIEEFRPLLADRVALTLINRRQIKPSGFATSETGAVTMDEATRKAVLTAWQAKKQEVVTHPFLGEKVTAGLLVHLQARLLARHLRGDLDAWPPLLWK
ncbi:type I-C CRISPR-associated endonuclease Cas1c [Alienimonas sp. DA493]|uniref:type I-C CRISPR-associated endonuclease Cas1c n=1 Tax=Alienimonas sp. DA493 TaxID=3373605 RepID=UPI003754F2CA